MLYVDIDFCSHAWLEQLTCHGMPRSCKRTKSCRNSGMRGLLGTALLMTADEVHVAAMLAVPLRTQMAIRRLVVMHAFHAPSLQKKGHVMARVCRSVTRTQVQADS